MVIKTEISSKNRMNFYPAQRISKDKCLEVADYKSARKSPFAENLFDIEGIESILIAPDMISILKEDNADWDEIKPFVLSEISDAIANGLLLETNNSGEIIEKIKGLINARIAPAIQRDQGDIEFVKFENNIVYVKLLGKCVGCAYAERTLKHGVEQTLKNYIPEVHEVKASEDE